MSEFNNPNRNSEKKLDNVILLKNPIGIRRASMKLQLNQKKVAIAASIVSIAFIVSLANQNLLSKNDSNYGRGIASTGSNSDFQWQYDLAQRLSKEVKHDLASLGTRPNEVDQLRFGLLEGKYALRFENGGLKEIEFIEQDSEVKPKYIGDKENFIANNKNLLKVTFKEIKKAETRNVANALANNETIEVYEMLDDHNKVQSRAEFKNDTLGRMLSFKVEQVAE